jgi:hypothetical protein
MEFIAMKSQEHLNKVKGGFRGWLIVGTMALLFLFYGFFMYFVVGDKGPPPWNFGVVEDVPGQSSYSTHPPRQGKGTEPEPQHVSKKPSKALMEVKKERP